MKSLFSPFLMATAAALFSLASCDSTKSDEAQPDVGTLDVALDHRVGDQPLTLDAPTYINPRNGEQFTISTFNYFISNIKLHKADGSEYVQPESYYLVKHSEAASQQLHLKDIPVGDYDGISFMVGVDSVRNRGGAYTGALSLDNNMSWNWAIGYIFLKMEGSLKAADTYSGKSFLMHVGGSIHPYNATRIVTIPLTDSKLRIQASQKPEIRLRVDALRVLNGPQPIQLSTYMGAHVPGANAMQVANNYAAGMFSLESTRQN